MGKKSKKEMNSDKGDMPETTQEKKQDAGLAHIANRDCCQNRELSWLKFDEGVLDEAGNPDVPLGERLNFISIFQTNLDEFFMVRVGTLMVQMESKEVVRENKTGMTSAEQVTAILEEVRRLGVKKTVIYNQLMGMIEECGLHVVNFNHLREDETALLETYFDTNVRPYLAPMIVGKRQPFPFLENKAIYACAALDFNGKKRLAIVPCSNRVFDRLIEIPSRPGTFVLSEELILHFIMKLFPKYRFIQKTLVRVTRNADIDIDEVYDEDMDYRDVMEKLVRQRRRLSPVRLEISRKMDKKWLLALCAYLHLDKNHVLLEETPLDFKYVFTLKNRLKRQNHPEYFYEKRVPKLTKALDMNRSILDQVSEHDVLLSYPYESMKPFIEMLREAAHDENVVSIRMTLYRVADYSKVVEALSTAAENGKEVIVLTELRARFDEENNIEASHILEDAGCQLLYGPDHYKVHSKICLITRKTTQGVFYITQVGTGNYNEKTAELYTDLSMITSDQDIGRDAADVFSALLQGDTVTSTRKMLIAPNCLQNRLLEMMDAEITKAKAGKNGYIGVKTNSLSDKVLIDKLIEASQAGVKIELIVRGICCLVPGIPGKTDNIIVIRVIGRYLEHSRIYRFGRGEGEKVYIASADFMTRNTTRRVEEACPVVDPALRKRVCRIFDTVFHDNVNGRQLIRDGQYAWRKDPEHPLDSQSLLYDDAADVQA